MFVHLVNFLIELWVLAKLVQMMLIQRELHLLMEFATVMIIIIGFQVFKNVNLAQKKGALKNHI
jgi:hypothetical protein